jgi:chromosome segregation ATPase
MGIYNLATTLCMSPLQICSLPSQLSKLPGYIYSYPLINRVATNWKAYLMDCSTAISVAYLAVSFFTSSLLVSLAYSVTAIASGIGSIYMRYYSDLTDLQETTKGLEATSQKFQKEAENYKAQNASLMASNQQYQNENRKLAESTQRLEAQINALTTQGSKLETNVQSLTLVNTQMTNNTANIRDVLNEMITTQKTAGKDVAGLTTLLGTLDSVTSQSNLLCSEIKTIYSQQQSAVSNQIARFEGFLDDLRENKALQNSVKALEQLKTQESLAAQRLHEIQLQSARELVTLQQTEQALKRTNDDFNRMYKEHTLGLRGQNTVLETNVTELGQQVQQFGSMIAGVASYLNSPPPSPVAPSSAFASHTGTPRVFFGLTTEQTA